MVRPDVRPRTCAGFTLVEVLVALAVGMLVIGVAVSAFAVDRNLIRRIQAVSAETRVERSLVVWAITRPGQGTAYPAGVQFHQIGAAAVTYLGGDHYYLMQVQDWSQAGAPPVVVCSLAVPVTAH
jgi:type II secretory pathway pseudopilin PulG